LREFWCWGLEERTDATLKPGRQALPKGFPTPVSKPPLLVRRNDEETQRTMEVIGILAFVLFTFVIVTRDPQEE
jgi:hypothetical protein